MSKYYGTTAMFNTNVLEMLFQVDSKVEIKHKQSKTCQQNFLSSLMYLLILIEM